MRFKVTIPLTQYLESAQELKEGQIVLWKYGSLRKDPKVTVGLEMSLNDILDRKHLFEIEVWVKIVD